MSLCGLAEGGWVPSSRQRSPWRRLQLQRWIHIRLRVKLSPAGQWKRRRTVRVRDGAQQRPSEQVPHERGLYRRAVEQPAKCIRTGLSGLTVRRHFFPFWASEREREGGERKKLRLQIDSSYVPVPASQLLSSFLLNYGICHLITGVSGAILQYILTVLWAGATRVKTPEHSAILPWAAGPAWDHTAGSGTAASPWAVGSLHCCWWPGWTCPSSSWQSTGTNRWSAGSTWTWSGRVTRRETSNLRNKHRGSCKRRILQVEGKVRCVIF